MKFSKGNKDTFYGELKQRVYAHLAERRSSVYATVATWLKGSVLLVIYATALTVILHPDTPFEWRLVSFVITGLTGVMLVFNLVHDASHQALSKNKRVNGIVTHLGDALGINMHIWHIRHDIQHHSFTNALGGDLIIENIPLLRLSPHQSRKPFHRYQPYYAPLLYLSYSFYWMFVIDFRLFLMKDICNLRNIKHPVREWCILIGGKIFYLSYAFVLPWLLTPLTFGETLLCFAAMHAAAGLLLSTVALLGHFVEGPVFPDTAAGVIDASWSEHELDATIDFAPRSRLAHFITGGLNTHVAHHLFPNVCHTHYYGLTKIIKAFCKEKGLTYRSETFGGALRSHFRHLKTLSLPTGAATAMQVKINTAA